MMSNEVEYTFADTGTFEIEVCGWYCDSLVCEIVVVVVNVGVEEFNIQDSIFRVCPNPFSESISIISSQNMQSIEIRNVLGEILLQQQAYGKDCRVDVGHFSKGIYLLEVNITTGVRYMKMMVRE